MTDAETRLRVRYAETDQMGVVYYANYIVWMEVGRVAFCKSRGLDYRDLERDGVLMAVVEVNCKYHAPARFDDEVIVKTRIDDANPRVIRFVYEMRLAEEDRKLASGFTRHVLVDRGFQRIRLPQKYFEVFGLK
ncbi:MAG TPA: thioesterase family protein [Bryobacteraceae bacterium]|nr:thioesterase family protein [Bryobacteraceae bacterium]